VCFFQESVHCSDLLTDLCDVSSTRPSLAELIDVPFPARWVQYWNEGIDTATLTSEEILGIINVRSAEVPHSRGAVLRLARAVSSKRHARCPPVQNAHP
jgi:hypothetical protein